MDFRWLVASVGLLVALVYILVMGPTKMHEGGWVGALHRFLTDTLWRHLYTVTARIIGQRAMTRLEAVQHYLFNSAHPLLQVFYMGLLTAGVCVFMWQGWPLLPGRYLSSIHSLTIPCAIAMTYGTYFLACYSDPGRVTEKNHRHFQKLSPYDKQIFPQVSECRTCKIPRPARSKHCSLCNMCVAKCDHHCAWLNNCVGYYNYRWFLAFLMSTGFICFYCTYVVVYLYWSEMDRQELLQLHYRDSASGQMVPVDLRTAILVLLGQYVHLGALGLFSSMAFVVVFFFFLYHVFLISKGMTTNESFKRQDYADLYEEQVAAGTLEIDLGPPPSHNLYHRGLWRNIMDVAFPTRPPGNTQ